MNRIRLLPEQVANQIAAGEVVERPASVVKEFVENAIDAGAARITVEIQAGGRSLIRVTDDGCGMGRDDALLCLERHATSKIQKAEDLASITTMGFRGEAIPSIASVSRMTLTTREAAAGEGTQVVIHGGKILEVKAAGCAPGTVMEARQLFFNLPARRKFLRTEETERAHVQHYLTLAALAHPGVAFTFIQEGRVVWQLAAAAGGVSPLDSLRERMRALYGDQARLIPVEHESQIDSGALMPPEEEAPVKVRLWGWIGAPGVSRSSREEQHLFVNRRPVENRALNFALLEGYHTALMKGRYPVCCLFLEIDPAEVDVNIHPAKREVKFHREQALRRIVSEAIRQALLEFHSLSPAPAAPPQEPGRLLSSTAPLHEPEHLLSPALPSIPNGGEGARRAGEEALGIPGGKAQNLVPANPPSSPAAAVPVQREFSVPLPGRPIADWPQRPEPAAASPAPAQPQANAPSVSAAPPHSPGVPVPLLQVPLRLVGVIGRLYVVLESDRGLVLLDQHAAHERILFEQMLDRMERNDAPSQRLLLPETVELSPRDANFLREQLANLARLGVGLSEFGERTFLLDGLPPFVKVPNARQFVLELIDELKSAGESVNSWRLGEHTIAKTVCRHAVKANDPLAGPELENLVEDLRRCAMPYTCPHGRPTLIEMNFRELEKKFGRAQ